MIRIETNSIAIGQTSGIEFGVPSYTSDKSAKIISTTSANNFGDLQFYNTVGTALGLDMIITGAGGIGIGTADPKCQLQTYQGVLNVTNTSPYAVNNNNNNMALGSLCIGDTLSDYGGGTYWNTNTAGLVMECANNTEIAVHDAGTRIASVV